MGPVGVESAAMRPLAFPGGRPGAGRTLRRTDGAAGGAGPGMAGAQEPSAAGGTVSIEEKVE